MFKYQYSIYLLLLATTQQLPGFDWQNYLNKYSDLRQAGVHTWHDACKHYLYNGIYEGRTSVSYKVSDTNFDWYYYKQTNNLPAITNEKQALEHYRNYGFFQQLSYCKQFTIAILLHLYDLKQLDKFIDRINRFVTLNDLNTYHLKITIPIDHNIHDFKPQQAFTHSNQLAQQLLAYTPYHPHVITPANSARIYALIDYIKKSIRIDENRIQILLTENRGMDIGGFLLSLDQLIKQNIEHDYIIKLHTKSEEAWYNLLTSFLNIRINKLLREKECVYSNKVTFNYINDESKGDKDLVIQLQKQLNLPQQNFNFCGGAMFIVSKKFTHFFKNHKLLSLYNQLNHGKVGPDGFIEHAFERIFGAITDYLKLNTQIIDYCPFAYPHDNTISQDKHLPPLPAINTVKHLIKKHNIQLMAIYFPQFHEVEENNRFWGKGFTEWTLLNKYAGEIKKPHPDIGQYNMLEYTTRKKQAILAKSHGISAFCYYHYWFKDRKVMYQGVEKILEDGEPNIPFIFCWANEPWTHNWDGSQQGVLINQEYGSPQDWIKHYRYLSQFFKHHNYIKEDGCPLLYVYRIEHIIKHNALNMFTLWKQLAIQDGFKGLKIISILGIFDNTTHGLEKYIDGYAEHQPTYNLKSGVPILSHHGYQHHYDAQAAYRVNQKLHNNYTHGLFYSWDNSSRKINKSSVKFIRLSYKLFEHNLVNTVINISKTPNIKNNFILLNSWNEWTEQAMIEPNNYDGYLLLRLLKKYFI